MTERQYSWASPDVRRPLLCGPPDIFNSHAVNPRAALFGKFFCELDPFAFGRELLVRAPVRPRFARQPHLFARDREVEVRVRIERILAERLAVAPLRL